MRKTGLNFSSIYRKVRRKEFTFSKNLLFLFMFCFSFSVGFAQQKINIKGSVVDELNEPIIGANVVIEGESIGTITDINGEFTLSVPAANSKLNISYLGYQTQIVSLNGRTSISVILKEDLLSLDEVVVVGYGTVKKRDLTGAISSIKSDDIVLAPTSNPMEALQGKIAGLDITRATGQAGEEVTMQLRGTRSFTAKGDPTFIIDGMPGDYIILPKNWTTS
ncbi:MAG: TonB-dependent receptor plug domain-containing protein [Bacteroidales bacterium]|nr:TonB-dependent receptor plug domain-containing protein [Bacteroidales bacterium]